MEVANRLRFLGQFVRSPGSVGAIAPSSERLARVITSWVRLPEADVVVAYGPGTGAFTDHIRRRLKPGATFFAIERDRVLYDVLRRRLPDVPLYCDSAAAVRRYLDEHGADRIDCIVCGLPWATFPAALQEELLQATHDALADGGQFVTFAYLHGLPLPAARRFRKRLGAFFSSVGRSRIVWPNLPPALVYQCTK